MSIWWSLQLRREAASVPLARRLLLGAMEAAGVDAEISHELSVALSEACSNAVRHAGGHSGVYRVTASINGDVCRIEVTDSGPGFPAGGWLPPVAGPAREPALGGRGLGLIEALSDRVRFGNQPGSGGAVITFDKVLKWREGALLRVS
ncbi:ATP-binding protein [Streptomyces sp. NPDC049881]|uniref:ATP-binding protein n=1 Tax=unclassified Streptomyces TaxID=2593676 RepID=UPI003428836C